LSDPAVITAAAAGGAGSGPGEGRLGRNVAAVAAMAYSLAEDENLPRPVIDKE